MSGRKHTAFIRAHRQRGCRQHIIVPERNSSLAKKSAEMGSLRHRVLSGTQLPLATKTGHGHFLPLSHCPELGQGVTMVEIMTRQEWLLPISRVFPSILSPQLHIKTHLQLKAEWLKAVHPKCPEERFGFVVCFFMIAWFVGSVCLLIWFLKLRSRHFSFWHGTFH